MAYGLLVIFSILITSTISFDENSHWDIYVRTLPVTPAQLVGSKYLFGLCGLALGTVCTVLIVALNNVLPPLLFWHTSYKVPPLECLAALLACGSMALLLVALLLPLSYRFNSVKARSWLFLVLSGLATGASWLCYYHALQVGAASKVVPLISSAWSSPALALWCCTSLYRQKPHRLRLITAGTLFMVL